MAKREINFFGEIGWGITAESIQAELNNTAGNDTPVLLVHSGGGSVYEGNAIYNIIRSRGGVEAKIIGVCASMATIIVSACDKVMMARNATYMIHRISGMPFGNPDEVESELKEMRALEDGLIKSLSIKSTLNEEEIKEKYFDGVDHYLTAEEALKEGFIDEIIDDEFDSEAPENFKQLEIKDKISFYKYAAKRKMKEEDKNALDKIWNYIKKLRNGSEVPEKVGKTTSVLNLSDGNYTLEDGRKISVKDGQVTELEEEETENALNQDNSEEKEKTETENNMTEEQVNELVENKLNSFLSNLENKLEEKFTQHVNALTEEKTELQKIATAVDERFTALAKGISTDYKAPTGQQTFSDKGQNQEVDPKSAFMAMRKKIKESKTK